MGRKPSEIAKVKLQVYVPASLVEELNSERGERDMSLFVTELLEARHAPLPEPVVSEPKPVPAGTPVDTTKRVAGTTARDRLNSRWAVQPFQPSIDG